MPRRAAILPSWFLPPHPALKRRDRRNGKFRFLRCQNLAGAVEVVLRLAPGPEDIRHPKSASERPRSDLEWRQVTGCTSPLTTITFTLPAFSAWGKSAHWADAYVFDAWGAVLARVAIPGLPD